MGIVEEFKGLVIRSRKLKLDNGDYFMCFYFECLKIFKIIY